MDYLKISELQAHPNLHSPVWVGPKGGHPQRGGSNLGVFVPIWPVSSHTNVMTGHIGTNTPKFVPSRWGWQPFGPTQTGLCKFGWAWSSLRELWNEPKLANPACPVQGSKNPKIGVKKNPISPRPQKRASRGKKSPPFTGHHRENRDFLDSKRPFLGGGEMGFFWLRNPLFPILGIFSASSKPTRICTAPFE